MHGYETTIRPVLAKTIGRGEDAQMGNALELLELIERNGRHEETRTPDLYRVKDTLNHN